MKTYNGVAQLVLTDDSDRHPFVTMAAALTLDTDELARQSLDWQGTLFGDRVDEIRLGSMFNTWLRVPGVDRDIKCYVEELSFTRDEVRIKLRDNDPQNPLSKKLSLASVVRPL